MLRGWKHPPFLLDSGAALLLGHSSVTVTQVYADIVDGRRKAAVDLFPKI